MKEKFGFKIFLSVLFISALVSKTDAATIYNNDFQSGSVGSEWTSSLLDTAPNPDLSSWGTFLGQFSGNTSVQLSLNNIPSGMTTLSFDTYFIRSWDGNDSKYGPDFYKVSLGNGTTLLQDTFSNGNPAGQSYVGDGIAAPAYAGTTNTSMMGSKQQYSLGYYFYDGIRGTNEAMDSIYHFSFTFYNPDDYLNVLFAGIGLQNNLVTAPDGEQYFDESWGLDNVCVDVVPVPEPTSLLLTTGGTLLGLIALRFRRREEKV